MASATIERLTLQLPPVHRGQLPIAQSKARFKVIICGRRFGKTTLGILECVKGAVDTGYTYWWVGPSYSVAQIGWVMLKKLAYQINDATGKSTIEIREADMACIFPNGGRIVIKSAVNPDSLRGEKLGGLVLDEFAQITEVTWSEVLRPSLADLKGWAMFIGTPKGRNWGMKLFEAAKNRPNWEAFKIPTAVTEDGTADTKVIGTNNPYIAVEELEQTRNEMSSEQFGQELLADFGASQYQVYPELAEETHTWRGPVPEFLSYHGGMDFGGDTIGAHYSTTVIAGKTAKDELIIIAAFKQAGVNVAERQYNWAVEQELKLAEVSKMMRRPYEGIMYRADKTQMVAIQLIRRSGLKVWPTKGGPDSVNGGIELLHRRLKLRQEMSTEALPGSKDLPIGPEKVPKPRLFVLPGVPFVLEDLMAYRYPEPHNDGRVESKNPMKVDDDMADAVRYMVEGADRGLIGDPQLLYGPLVPRLA